MLSMTLKIKYLTIKDYSFLQMEMKLIKHKMV